MTERACPAVGELVEEEVNKVATQYREAAKFLGFIRAVLGEGENAAIKLCALPDSFDVDTAIGDQLTIIGKWLGFPRCHCVRDAPKVFGFKCGPFASSDQIAGFCEPGSAWSGCPPLGNGEVCISDDEVFRGFVNRVSIRCVCDDVRSCLVRRQWKGRRGANDRRQDDQGHDFET